METGGLACSQPGWSGNWLGCVCSSSLGTGSQECSGCCHQRPCDPASVMGLQEGRSASFHPLVLSFMVFSSPPRTQITRTCGTAATSTGACSPRTLWLPRRWCWPRSHSSLRRRTSSSPRCWTSSSATSARWPLSTTSRPAPSWREAGALCTRACHPAPPRECSGLGAGQSLPCASVQEHGHSGLT